MGRYIGPVSRLCRREGTHLFIRGWKCQTGKCPGEKRAYPPGQHGQGRVRLSDYGVQLREKQKVKRMYGVRERQFRRYFTSAKKGRGVTGQILLQLLERRLDNVLYRMGFSTSRREGRQIVRHRGMMINGKVVDIPSYSVNVGDVIQVVPKREGQANRIKANLERMDDLVVPPWLQVDSKILKGVIIRVPQKEDVGVPILEQLIVELYSK